MPKQRAMPIVLIVLGLGLISQSPALGALFLCFGIGTIVKRRKMRTAHTTLLYSSDYSNGNSLRNITAPATQYEITTYQESVSLVTPQSRVISPGTPLVFFDVETTGLNSQFDVITEIAGVKFIDGVLVDEFSSLVNAGNQIPADRVKFNGITTEMVLSAPLERDVIGSFLAWADEAVLVAHNAPYDVSFIYAAAQRTGHYWPGFAVIDTLTVARNVLPKNKVGNYKLETLARYFGISSKSTHRALDDTRILAGVSARLFGKAGNLDRFADKLGGAFWREYKELNEVRNPNAAALRMVAEGWYGIRDENPNQAFFNPIPREALVYGRHFTEWVEPIKQFKREGKKDEALALILDCVDAVERTAAINSESPAPAYTEMAAIMYRQSKDYPSEIAIIERYFAARNRANIQSPGAMNAKLLERLAKARELAAKQYDTAA